jgi:hypothetical protein
MSNSNLDSNEELKKYGQQLGFTPLSPAESIELPDTPDTDIFNEEVEGASDTQSRAKNPVLQYGAAALIGTIFVGLPLAAMLGIGGGKQVAKTTEPKEKTGAAAASTADPEVDKLKTNIALDIQAKQSAPPTTDAAQSAQTTQNPNSEPTATPAAKPVTSAVTQAPAAKPATPTTPVPTVKPIAPAVATAPSTIAQPIPARSARRSPDGRVENPPKSTQQYPSPYPVKIATLPTTATRVPSPSQPVQSQIQRKPFGVDLSRPVQHQAASLPNQIASLPISPKVPIQHQAASLPSRFASQALPSQIAALPKTSKRQFRSLPNQIAAIPSRIALPTTAKRQFRSLPNQIAALPTATPQVPTQLKPFQPVKPNGGVQIAANLRPTAAIWPITPSVPTTPVAPPMSYQEASALSIYGGDGDTPVPTIGTKSKNNDLASAAIAQNLSPALPLPVGIVVSGHTITPYNSISKGNAKQAADVSVMLDQPIQLAQGYSLPVGTIVQFGATVADNGLVQATSKGVYINNSPIQVPVGAFALTAENSQALIAQQRAMRQDELASADTKTALYGALGTVGQVVTQAGNQTVLGTTGIGTVTGIQTNNPTPNLLAAAAQGAFQPLLTANHSRTTTATTEILGLSKINTLPVQTKVKVFVSAPGIIQIPLAGNQTAQTQSSQQYQTALDVKDPVAPPIDPQLQPTSIAQPYSPAPQLPPTSSTNPTVQIPQPTYLQAPQVQPYSPVPQVQPVQPTSPIQPTQPNYQPTLPTDTSLNPAGFSEAVTARGEDR